MLDDRPPGLKWNYFDPDVLPAWVAEMDYGLAPAISEALHRAVDRGDTGYLYPEAIDGVARSASRFWNDRFGWEVDPLQVSHAPDVVEGLRRVIMHLTTPGAPVILPTPAYFPFFWMIERAGREKVEVRSNCDPEGRWTLDLEGIDRAFAAGAGSVILCNPWNPVGRCLTREEIADVCAIAASHGGRVLADEVHGPLTYPGSEHIPAALIDPETVVTVTAASKAWNIPGLKAAQVVVSNDRDLAVWSRDFTIEKFGVSTFGLLASAAAYSDGGDWLDGVRDRLDVNRTLFAGLVDELLPGATHHRPEGTYLAWVDLSSYGHPRPGEYLLEHARVGVSEGAEFGAGGEGHIRFNFATEEYIVTEMVERMAKVL